MRVYQFLVFIISVQAFSQLNIDLVELGNNFDKPVDIKHAGDERLFVVEQKGVIKILNPDGTVNSKPFLDINDRVKNLRSSYDERGLLGVAFHPNYKNNGRFYVNYIDNKGDTVIARYLVSSNNPNVANYNSEKTIEGVDQPFSNHNGGDLRFGPDGYLYIATGDGGSGGDPKDSGQDLNSLLGKILRIDVNDDSNNSYSIPNGNPFANDNNSRTHETIWAYGLRNPWKFSFDKETGEIWIADVGQNLYEEINVALGITGGINYGWRCYEGNHQYNLDDCPEKRTLTFPIAEYSHSNNGNFKCSVTGGYRYRGTKYPKFKGVYFFADYCSDEIGYLEEKNGKWEMNFTQPFKGNNWSTFGEGYRGELYLAGIATGKVFKIVDKEAFNNQVEFNVFYMKDKELIQVEFLKNQNLLKEVKVFSVTGKLIDHIKQAFSSASALSIETSNNYKKGVYIVQIILKNGQKESKRVVID